MFSIRIFYSMNGDTLDHAENYNFSFESEYAAIYIAKQIDEKLNHASGVIVYKHLPNDLHSPVVYANDFFMDNAANWYNPPF